MTDTPEICIYCKGEFDARAGEGDHVLPRGFGKFDNAIIFRGACQACNNKLSPLEEEVLRTGPEAVLRRFAGAATNRRGKKVGWQAASSTPPPRFVIKHADHDQLIHADSTVGGDSRPVDQIALVLKNAETKHVRFFEGMSPDALRRKLKGFGVVEDDIDRVFWHASEETADAIVGLLRELWPEHRHEERPATEAGVHRVPVRIECRVTSRYFRAIAKTAFHYFLANTRCGFTGHEDSLGEIRHFIMDGGDPGPFFDRQKLNVELPIGKLPDGSALLPARWMHVLFCVESTTSVVVGVYTLFGPQRPPSPYFVTILHRPGALLVPEHQYGHAYVHGSPELGDNRDAFVERLIAGRIR